MLKKIPPRLTPVTLSRVSAKPLDTRITGREHGRIRQRVLLRDEYTCRACGRVDPGPWLVVDHIKPLCDGGLESDDNRQVLCVECHAAKTAAEAAARAKCK